MASETLAPDALITNTYAAGTVTSIQDDPGTPDGNWLTLADDGNDAVAHMSFGTPSFTPSGTQTFRIWIRKAFLTGGGNPTFTVELRENNTTRSTLASGVTIADNATGVLYSYTWDASLLTGAPDGSQVELYFSATSNLGGPNARSIEFGAAAWDVVGLDRRVIYFM